MGTVASSDDDETAGDKQILNATRSEQIDKLTYLKELGAEKMREKKLDLAAISFY